MYMPNGQHNVSRQRQNRHPSHGTWVKDQHEIVQNLTNAYKSSPDAKKVCLW